MMLPSGRRSRYDETREKRVHGLRRRQVIVPIGPSIAYVPLTQGYYALIDVEDAGWAGVHNWCAWWNGRKTKVYAKRQVVTLPASGLQVCLHHAVLDTALRPSVRFLNGNTLDCRKANLVGGGEFGAAE
jgi:hypothetical protein